jgi:choline dehydrogenase-like flavoprotein
MTTGVEHLRAQTVVVGSGPGGATVARELARRGHEVLLLEQGAYHRPIGSYITLFRMLDRFGMRASIEGTAVARLLTVGGSSVAFCGTALPPPPWLKDRYGIDLAPYVEEATEELGLAPLPERLIGQGAKRIRQAAGEEGLDWRPLVKFIDAGKCDLECPKCYAGCAKGAKWTARDYVREALGGGARLLPRRRVEQVTASDGRVTGIQGVGPSGPFAVEAETVVLAAGGVGTPIILQASGFSAAGRGFFIDPLMMTYGTYPGRGSGRDIPMSCGTTDLQDEGIIMTDVIDPWPLYLFGLFLAGPRHLPSFARYPHTLGIMTKVRDELNGSIAADGTISKPIGEEEKSKLARGSELAARILRRAGCDPASIVDAPLRGAHPGGTARIGELVDTDLQTEIAGLYVCDASVLPEPCGLPPVLTLIGLGKRLVAERLVA